MSAHFLRGASAVGITVAVLYADQQNVDLRQSVERIKSMPFDSWNDVSYSVDIYENATLLVVCLMVLVALSRRFTSREPLPLVPSKESTELTIGDITLMARRLDGVRTLGYAAAFRVTIPLVAIASQHGPLSGYRYVILILVVPCSVILARDFSRGGAVMLASCALAGLDAHRLATSPSDQIGVLEVLFGGVIPLLTLWGALSYRRIAAIPGGPIARGSFHVADRWSPIPVTMAVRRVLSLLLIDVGIYLYRLLVVAAIAYTGWLPIPFAILIASRDSRATVRMKRNRADAAAWLAEEWGRRDTRPTILYLRTFGDDDALHRFDPDRSRTTPTTTDVVLESLWGYGPVVGFGIPGRKGARATAALEYIGEWRQRFFERADDCGLIACLLGNSETFAWELEQIARRNNLHKLVLIVPSVSAYERAQRWETLFEHLERNSCTSYDELRVVACDDLIAATYLGDHWLLLTAKRRSKAEYDVALRLCCQLQREHAERSASSRLT